MLTLPSKSSRTITIDCCGSSSDLRQTVITAYKFIEFEEQLKKMIK